MKLFKPFLISTVSAAVMLLFGGITEVNGDPLESIQTAIELGNIEAVKQHLDDGADVNAKGDRRVTPLDMAIQLKKTEIANLIRKHLSSHFF